MVDIVVPELGTSPEQPITISSWLVRPGDAVLVGDRVVEILLDEITFDIPSPASGTLVEVAREVDERVRPGEVVGIIDVASPSSRRPA